MAAVGEAWQNGYAERVIRTIKGSASNWKTTEDYADARARIGTFLQGRLTTASASTRRWAT